MSQVADSPAPEAGWSGLSQDGSALKVGQASQHGSSVAVWSPRPDGPQPRKDRLVPLREA
jgi:hypothetical protein